jgi:hypothetical protein
LSNLNHSANRAYDALSAAAGIPWWQRRKLKRERARELEEETGAESTTRWQCCGSSAAGVSLSAAKTRVLSGSSVASLDSGVGGWWIYA